MTTELASKRNQYVLNIIRPSGRTLSQLAAYYQEQFAEIRRLLPSDMRLADVDEQLGFAFVTCTSEDYELLQSRIGEWATLIHRKRKRAGGL